MNKVLAGFFAAIMFVAILIPLTLLRGYAACQCWEWFMVPTFGLPHLGIVQALGIITVIGIFSPHHYINDDDKAEEWHKKHKSLLLHFLYPPTALLFGYIYHLFM